MKTQSKEDENENSLTILLAKNVWMEFVRVPAGKFLMGSDEKDEDANEDEKPQHTVYLDDYWMGKYPVTKQQFHLYVLATKTKSPEDWIGNKPPKGKEYHPVTFVNWQDAQNFCRWASKMTGEDIYLPSEAEWEKAARGTRHSSYPWGDEEPHGRCCYFYGSVGWTDQVGVFSPAGDSPYGCADMSGNVNEWVEDWYDEDSCYYQNSPKNNPKGPTSGEYRVLRGGSFNEDKKSIRCAYRLSQEPLVLSSEFGFRCALHIRRST